jgi:hypothetical protein
MLTKLSIKNLINLIYYYTKLPVTCTSSVADPRCFIPDPDPTIAPSRIPDPTLNKGLGGKINLTFMVVFGVGLYFLKRSYS